MFRSWLVPFVRLLPVVAILLSSNACDRAIEDVSPVYTAPDGRTFTIHHDGVPENVRYLRDIEYATREDDQHLRLDILYTADAEGTDGTGGHSRPAIITIHGGGFLRGDKADSIGMLPELALAGYVVAAVNYRLAPAARFPAQLEDVRAAVRWMRDHANELGIDPGRIGVWGVSAGATLALLLGTTGDEEGADGSQVQAVCAWYGTSDYTDPHYRRSESIRALLGGPVEGDLVGAVGASAVFHVDGNEPPILLMHGAADPNVPTHQSERMHAVLTAKGSDSTLHIIPDEGHGFRDAARYGFVVRDWFQEHL